MFWERNVEKRERKLPKKDALRSQISFLSYMPKCAQRVYIGIQTMYVDDVNMTSAILSFSTFSIPTLVAHLKAFSTPIKLILVELESYRYLVSKTLYFSKSNCWIKSYDLGKRVDAPNTIFKIFQPF